MAVFCRAGVLLGVALGLTLALAPRRVRAEAPTPFRVESLPGADCPSGDPFAAQLLRRTDRIRAAVRDERALVFRLEVRPEEKLTSGRLTVRELDGSETEREVAGATCQEVVAAMVLIAAILVDPNASLEPLPPPEAARRPPPDPPRAGPALPASPRAPRGPLIPAGRTPPPGALVRPRDAIEPAPPAAVPAEPGVPRGGEPAARGGFGQLSAGAGVGFALEGAPMPKLAAGLAVLGVVTLERRSILSPMLEGSAVRTQTVQVQTPSGDADFRFSSLRLLPCPVRFPPVSSFAARPCALVELGELVGVGKVTEGPERVEARWVAVGGAARVSVRLFGPLVVVAEGGLVVPLIRHEFYFDPQGPETTALDVPTAGFSSRLGVVAEVE